MQDSLRINSAWLRDRLVALGLTQWWVAEQIGVDRRTVMRWANGQVRSIRSDNARALADVLDCRVHDLVEVRDAQSLGTLEDQRAAARALAEAGVLDKLGPSHQWDVAESLLKATAVRDLASDVLGRLYYQLGVACWRQDKLAEAGKYNDAALAIAVQGGDCDLEARALGSRANLEWWRGETAAALQDWRRALGCAATLPARDRASLHSNVGASLYEIGHVEAGRSEIETALDLLRRDGTPTQKSIAHAHLALLALDADDMREAARHARRSAALARRADYRRGLALAHLLAADVRAAAGDEVGASAEIANGLAAFAALGIAEGMTQRLAGRAWRRLGRLADAAVALRAGLPVASAFPREEAELHAELALVSAMQGEARAAHEHADRAATLYAACGAPLRIARLVECMSPHVAWRPSVGALP